MHKNEKHRSTQQENQFMEQWNSEWLFNLFEMTSWERAENEKVLAVVQSGQRTRAEAAKDTRLHERGRDKNVTKPAAEHAVGGCVREVTADENFAASLGSMKVMWYRNDFPEEDVVRD